jgi:hypothetical protein
MSVSDRTTMVKRSSMRCPGEHSARKTDLSRSIKFKRPGEHFVTAVIPAAFGAVHVCMSGDNTLFE